MTYTRDDMQTHYGSELEQLAYDIAVKRCSALSDTEAAERASFLDANIERLNAIQEWELRLLQEGEGGITIEGQLLGHRYIMGHVNAYCPKCSSERGVTVLDCDYDIDK